MLVLTTVGRGSFGTLQSSEADGNDHLDLRHKVARSRVVATPIHCHLLTFQPNTARPPGLQPPSAVSIELALRMLGLEESPAQFFDEVSMPCDAPVSPEDS
jgi:hypothetical protein